MTHRFPTIEILGTDQLKLNFLPKRPWSIITTYNESFMFHGLDDKSALTRLNIIGYQMYDNAHNYSNFGITIIAFLTANLSIIHFN